jgi:hypothetical protein
LQGSKRFRGLTPASTSTCFEIEVLTEVAPAIAMSGPELLKRTGLHTVRLAQFPKIQDDEVVMRLEDLLSGR